MNILPEPSKTIDNSAKWMTLIAWVLGLGICIWAFSSLLERQENPNQTVESVPFQGGIEIKLKRNRRGHYVLTGQINNRDVTFLVDTGATAVSVPAHLAKELELIPLGRGIARTANGNVEIAFTQIDKLRIGEIELSNIEANINPGMESEAILLGMSALKYLEFTQRGEWLILRTF